MTDYAKLYARLCGAIDEVLDELGTIPEARHAREKLQAAILDAEAQYLDTEEEKKSGRVAMDSAQISGRSIAARNSGLNVSAGA